MKNFGKTYGVMGALMALAARVGPMLAGITYDRFGGYGPFLAPGAVACALAGILLFSLPVYPVWGSEETKPARPPQPRRRAEQRCRPMTVSQGECMS